MSGYGDATGGFVSGPGVRYSSNTDGGRLIPAPAAPDTTGELREAARGWILRHSSQPDGDRWRDNHRYLDWAADNLLCDLAPWLSDGPALRDLLAERDTLAAKVQAGAEPEDALREVLMPRLDEADAEWVVTEVLHGMLTEMDELRATARAVDRLLKSASSGFPGSGRNVAVVYVADLRRALGTPTTGGGE